MNQSGIDTTEYMENGEWILLASPVKRYGNDEGDNQLNNSLQNRKTIQLL